MKKKPKKATIKVPLREASLKRKLRKHLASVGFTKGPDGTLQIGDGGKEVVRFLHHAQRNDLLRANSTFIAESYPELIKHFASGTEIDVPNIRPALERVRPGTWQSELFRFAALTWAVPVSSGFGRRLRYLVWDRNNDKLIGLIAVGDPVFNLGVRDQLIGWNHKDRGKRLVNILDAYVLGAVPPYNMLLGGKLVASLVRSRDLYEDFAKTYGNAKGIISKKTKKPRLLAVTTSSSLGRSSIYNRLKLNGTQYFCPIGYTGGWGHFHIPDDLFLELRDYLRANKHHYADENRFGQGPNWKLRTTREALKQLGFKEDMLRHGVKREVFICPLASNYIGLLKKPKKNGRANLRTLLKVDEIAALALKRWVVPRSERRPEFRLWRVENLRALLREQHLFPQAVAVKR